MKKLKIHVTFTEGILGTATADPEIYSRFIGSKSPDAATLPEEVAALGEDAIIERGTTVFPKDENGTQQQRGMPGGHDVRVHSAVPR